MSTVFGHCTDLVIYNHSFSIEILFLNVLKLLLNFLRTLFFFLNFLSATVCLVHVQGSTSNE